MPKLLNFTNPITIPVLPLSTHFDLTGVQKLDGFSQVNVAIIVNQPVLFPLNARVFMGVLSASPLSALIDSFAVPRTVLDKIRTYPVTGPELSIALFGDPGTYPIRAWVYLT